MLPATQSYFQAAEENKMSIVEQSVGLEEILTHLETSGPVIVLTNANLLTCSHCSNYGANCYQFCFSSSVSYQETLISVLRVLLALLSEVCMGLYLW